MSLKALQNMFLYTALPCTVIIVAAYSFFFADRYSKDHFQSKYHHSLEGALAQIDYLRPEWNGNGVEILLDHPQNLDVRGDRIIQTKDDLRRVVEAMFQTERTNSGTNYLKRLRGTLFERTEAMIADDLNLINTFTRFRTSVGPMQLENSRALQTLDHLVFSKEDKADLMRRIHEYEPNLMIGALTLVLADGETVAEKAKDYNSVAYDPIVARIQQLIRDQGATISVDGIMGIETQEKSLENAALFFDLKEDALELRVPATGEKATMFMQIYQNVEELHRQRHIPVNLDSKFSRLFMSYYLTPGADDLYRSASLEVSAPHPTRQN